MHVCMQVGESVSTEALRVQKRLVSDSNTLSHFLWYRGSPETQGLCFLG